ncbi:MAG: hypothetical protein ACTHK4_15005 [Mycobacteriales bacterium]
MKVLAGRRPSAAGVIAVVALVCAMSGTAVASSAALHNGDKLIKKHTLSGNRLRNHTVTSTQVRQPVWHALTLENGWAADDAAHYGTPSYAIDDQGFVHLRGAITGAAATAGTFPNLPAGYRPGESFVQLPVASNNGANDPQTAVIIVENGGDVLALGGKPANLDFVSLAGASFPAG